MKVDLFELLDGFFRGVVQFVYSLLASIFWLLRHPVRGPTYLQRARQEPERRQVSAVTLLFTAYLAAHAYGMRGYWLGPYSSASSLELRDWWPVLAASLISTVIVDSALRLAVRWRYRERRRRELVLATTEYAMFFPALLVTVGFLKAEQGTLFTLLGPSGKMTDLASSLLHDWRTIVPALGITCILVTPAVMRLWPDGLRTGHDRAGKASDGATAARAGRWAMRWLGLAALAMLASTAGGAVRIHAFLDLIADPHVRVQNLVCHLDGGQPYVDAILVNDSRSPVEVEVPDLVLQVVPLEEDVLPEQIILLLDPEDLFWLSFPLQSAEEAPPDVLLPGQVRFVRAGLAPSQPGQARLVLARLAALRPWMFGQPPRGYPLNFVCALGTSSNQYTLTGPPSPILR